MKPIILHEKVNEEDRKEVMEITPIIGSFIGWRVQASYKLCASVHYLPCQHGHVQRIVMTFILWGSRILSREGFRLGSP